MKGVASSSFPLKIYPGLQTSTKPGIWARFSMIGSWKFDDDFAVDMLEFAGKCSEVIA
jgi:hypothetical protein